jgi:hypothetical protein
VLSFLFNTFFLVVISIFSGVSNLLIRRRRRRCHHHHHRRCHHHHRRRRRRCRRRCHRHHHHHHHHHQHHHQHHHHYHHLSFSLILFVAGIPIMHTEWTQEQFSILWKVAYKTFELVHREWQ